MFPKIDSNDLKSLKILTFLFLNNFLESKYLSLSVMMTFLTLNIFTCLNRSLIFLFTDNKIISKFFLSFLTISISVFPIDPVDPKIAIFFSF